MGWVILGANELARTVGHALRRWNEDVVLLDTNPQHCMAAEREGLRVIHGNGLDTRTLHRASLDTRAGALGVSTNSQVNLAFAQLAKSEGKLTRRYAGVGRSQAAFNLQTAEQHDIRILFGHPVDLEHWVVRLRRADAQPCTYAWEGPAKESDEARDPLAQLDDSLILPLARRRRDSVQPVTEALETKQGDQVAMLVDAARRQEVTEMLEGLGWRTVAIEDDPRNEAA